MRNSNFRVRRALVLAGALTVALTACSQQSPGAGPSGSPTEEAGGLAAAQQVVDEFYNVPDEINISEPLSKAPETGKTVVFVEPNVAVGPIMSESVRNAAEAVGWEAEIIVAGSTPQDTANAWKQVVLLEPDAVIGAGNPTALFSESLAELEARDVPYVAVNVAEEVGGNTIAVVASGEASTRQGRIMAAWVASETECEGNSVFYNLPNYPTIALVATSFAESMATFCPDYGVTVKDIDVRSTGVTLPAEVVADVTRLSDVNYLVFGGSQTVGVPEALAEAGLADGISIISGGGNEVTYSNIENGNVEVANVPSQTVMLGWFAVDALSRHFNGDDLPIDAYALAPTQIVTEKDIEDPKLPWRGVPGYADQFKALWLVE